MLTTGVQMNPLTLTQIQRQSIHEFIVETYQQNSPISKDATSKSVYQFSKVFLVLIPVTTPNDLKR